MSLMSADQAKARNKPITSYAPIARSLLVMDKTLEEKMCKKFDICYVLAKENLAFRKYPAIHEILGLMKTMTVIIYPLMSLVVRLQSHILSNLIYCVTVTL